MIYYKFFCCCHRPLPITRFVRENRQRIVKSHKPILSALRKISSSPSDLDTPRFSRQYWLCCSPTSACPSSLQVVLMYTGLGAGFACENQSKKLFEFLSLSHIVQNYLVSSNRPASTLVTSMLVGFLVSLRSLTNINSNIQDFDLPDFVCTYSSNGFIQLLCCLPFYWHLVYSILCVVYQLSSWMLTWNHF